MIVRESPVPPVARHQSDRIVMADVMKHYSRHGSAGVQGIASHGFLHNHAVKINSSVSFAGQPYPAMALNRHMSADQASVNGTRISNEIPETNVNHFYEYSDMAFLQLNPVKIIVSGECQDHIGDHDSSSNIGTPDVDAASCALKTGFIDVDSAYAGTRSIKKPTVIDSIHATSKLQNQSHLNSSSLLVPTGSINEDHALLHAQDLSNSTDAKDIGLLVESAV